MNGEMQIINEGIVSFTPEDEKLLRDLDAEHYLLRRNQDDKLELFLYRGGYATINPYVEESTGEAFESIDDAHKWVFGHTT